MSDEEQVLSLREAADILEVPVGLILEAAKLPGCPLVRWRGETYEIEGIPATAVAKWIRYVRAHVHQIEER